MLPGAVSLEELSQNTMEVAAAERALIRNKDTFQAAAAILAVLVIVRFYASLGRSKTNRRTGIVFHHAPDSAMLPLRDGSEQSVADLCKEMTPDCKLNPVLFSGHLQTMWAAASQEGPSVIYKRRVFQAEETQYPGSFAVDFVADSPSGVDSSLPERTSHFEDSHFETFRSDDSKPMLIALPGLKGGSYEAYIRQVVGPLVEQHGWEACVVSARGCAMSHVTSRVLYNARSMWDVRQTIKWLLVRFPNRPLFAIGFSIGANILTNYLGEEGSNCKLKAAVVCSNPWNLDICANNLQQTHIGLEVYSRAMCESKKSLVILHDEEIAKNTDIDVAAVEKIRYLHEFDRLVQCPTWGYPTEGAYYRDASCVDSLLAVRIPLIALNALDDPISTSQAVPFLEFEKHPLGVLVTTTSGGHLGWFQQSGARWFATAAVAYLDKIAKDVWLDQLKPSGAPRTLPRRYHPMRRHLSTTMPDKKPDS